MADPTTPEAAVAEHRADYFEVHVTTETEQQAEAICAAAVRARVAACAQIAGPITSTFWWEGELEREREYLILLKTTRDRFAALRDVVVAEHPYDVPQVTALAVEDGLGDYLSWVTDETRQQG